MLLSIFDSILNHRPIVSIQEYDSAVASVIFFNFAGDELRNFAFHLF